MVCGGDSVGVPGASCNALPNVTRLIVADGPASWRGRETQVCYATGEAADPEV
jgi:hypothetical protein